MAREIKLALMYRDMWQSSGKYMPRVDQLIKVAGPIIDMGCFDRVETNGGGFEQINLLYGENPNHSVRAWSKDFNASGIQTQMLERGLNGIRMSPVPVDVRNLMFKLKKKQGTDIARSFDGLNNPQNLKLSFEFAKSGGMIPQGALCITFSPLHTVDYYVNLADQYIELGAEEICLKDMAGIGRPVSIGKIVKGIRERHPTVIIQYHGHSTPGFSVASSLEAARNGADIIDVGMEPLSWGTGHADVITIVELLKDAGFQVKDVDMKAYMHARSLTQEFIDDFLGYFINPKNRYMNSFLIGPGLPGGMMGSLMADLEKNLKSLNKWLNKNQKTELSQDEFLLMLFNEVQHIWPMMGYPPLVTPFSQYVKNAALMNVVSMQKGKSRWSMLDENTWGMILGNSGRLLGELDPDILDLAKVQEREFFEGNPQDLYPDELQMYASKMDEQGWEYGQDDEELFEYAMHPNQYLNFRSGKAKEDFEKALTERKSQKTPSEGSAQLAEQPNKVFVNVDGRNFEVLLDWSMPGDSGQKREGEAALSSRNDDSNGFTTTISAPLEGKFYLTKDNTEKPLKVGDTISPGDTVAYIESMKVINAITSDKAGTIVDIMVNHGEDIEEDEIIFKLR